MSALAVLAVVAVVVTATGLTTTMARALTGTPAPAAAGLTPPQSPGADPTAGGLSSPDPSAAQDPAEGEGLTADEDSTERWQAVVDRIGVQAKDLPRGYTLQAMPGGDDVTSHRTLDNCAHRFVSEADRVVRRQTLVLAPGGTPSGLSGEVAAYDSADHATAALREWTQSVARCRANTVSTSDSGRSLRWISEVTGSDPALPIAANQVTRATLQDVASGRKVYTLGVLQQRGRVLAAVWLAQLTPITAQNRSDVLTLAAFSGRRLAEQQPVRPVA